MFTQTTEKKPHSENRIPEYEHIFDAVSDTKKKGAGFIGRIVRKDFWKLVFGFIVYTIKASPVWVIPVITSAVLNLLENPGEDFYRKIIILGIVCFVDTVQNIPGNYIYCKIMNSSIRNATAGIRLSVIRKLQRLSITYHKEMEEGRIQSKFLRDIDAVDAYYRNMLYSFVPCIIGVVVSTAIAFTKSWLITLIIFGIIPINLLNVWLFRRKMKDDYRDVRKKNEDLSATTTTLLQMLTVSKAHGLEEVEADRTRAKVAALTDAGLRTDRHQAGFGAVMWVVSTLLSVATLFISTVICHETALIAIGDVILFRTLFGSINGDIQGLINLFPSIVAGKEAVQSLSEILDSADMENPGGAAPVPAIRGEVDFKNVFYRYPNGDKDVVQDINFHVGEGECIAVVGSSGSGKSTLMNLLIGLLSPTSGQILIDGTSLSDMPISSYRHQISVVPQNSILFPGTVKQNITYGLTHYSEADFNRVLEDAAVNEFLPSLPGGVNCPVGEHGDKLSGGQKQRVCIARALLRNPRILIMDEATSALDNVSEYHIQKAINKLIKSRTTFIVAHRLSTIRNADRILVMDDGRIIECGSYEELMAREGKFFEMEKLSRIREEEAAKNNL